MINIMELYHDMDYNVNIVDYISNFISDYISNFIPDYRYLNPNNRYLRIVLTPLFVSPIILIGTLLSRILPSDNKLYLNNVIFCKKVNNLNNN